MITSSSAGLIACIMTGAHCSRWPADPGFINCDAAKAVDQTAAEHSTRVNRLLGHRQPAARFALSAC